MRRATWLALGIGLVALGGCRDGGRDPVQEDTDGSSGDASSGGDDTADTTDTGDTDGDPTGDDGTTGDEPDGANYLEPTERLNRASMALRGIRPSAEDLAAVADDPDRLTDIIDGYLEGPEFGATMRDLHNDALLVLADSFLYPAGFPMLPPLEAADPYEVNRSVTEGPLRLIEHVIANDRPYTEIVTADYVVANESMATVWGIDYTGDGGWDESQWPDARPRAGILSDSWLYQRHRSTPSNGNRGRANAISRALLCYDFLDRDIEIDASINLADPDQVDEAVTSNPACATCHQALDPLAGFFGDYVGLFVPADLPSYGVTQYPYGTFYPGFFEEQYGVTLRDPTFFGMAGNSIEDLGVYIAADPRFSLCTAKRFYAYFHQVPLQQVPLQQASELQAEFVGQGFDAKSLARAIVLSDDFNVSYIEEGFDGFGGVKKARPHQLGALVRDVTGFSWTTRLVSEPDSFDTGTIDLLSDSFFGYQVLAGGIDSIFVNKPSHTYSATASLVLQQLAEESAGYVVDNDFDVAAGQRRLFTAIDDGETEEAQVRGQIAILHERVYGQLTETDAPDVDDTYALFAAALEHSEDPRRAWKTTLAAMLQDMQVAYY